MADFLGEPWILHLSNQGWHEDSFDIPGCWMVHVGRWHLSVVDQTAPEPSASSARAVKLQCGKRTGRDLNLFSELLLTVRRRVKRLA